MLNSYYHEGIPVGVNRNSSFKSPGFALAMNYKWGEEAGLNQHNGIEAISLIKEILSQEKSKVSFICLGSMSTVFQALKNIPELHEKVKEIIWSADGLTDKKGFNFNIDKVAAQTVLKGDITVRVVNRSGEDNFYNDITIKAISEIHTIYAEKISEFFKSKDAVIHAYSFAGTDEMVPIYLHHPELFKNESEGNDFLSTPVNTEGLRSALLQIIAGETVAKNQVIKEFSGISVILL